MSTEKQIFKEVVFAFGDVKLGETIKFEFELAEDASLDEIDYYYNSCGSCTTTNFEGRKVFGTIDATKAAGAGITQKTVVNKTINIFLNDGVPEFRGNKETKLREFNPEKKRVILQLAGTVSP